MVNGFSRAQIALHWVVGLFIIYQLWFGDDMSHLWRQMQQTGPAPTTTGAWVHIILGTFILALVASRLTLRFTRGVPKAPPGESRALTLAGEAGHILLYILMIALPVTGLVAWYGGLDIMAELHGGILKALLWLVIAGHVLAAIYHHFILKDGLLNRMRKPG